jgi:hypothetical protein
MNQKQTADSSAQNDSKPFVVRSAFRYIKLFLKKRRLLKKYKRTDKNLADEIHLYTLFRDDLDALCYFNHIYSCERRCYERLKKL